MSNSDESASRRGRRPEQGNPQWRQENTAGGQDRWQQSSDRPNDPYFHERGRDERRPDVDRAHDQRKPSYSNFSGHSYPTEPQPSPASLRPREAAPQPIAHNNHPEPVAPREPARDYNNREFQNYPPPPPSQNYQPEYPPAPQAHQGRDDPFREPLHPALNGGYGDQREHPRNDIFDRIEERQPSQANPRHMLGSDDHSVFFAREAVPSPMDEYERNFAARIAAQESQGASRFYLPEEHSAVAQPPQNYAAPHNYAAGPMDAASLHRAPAASYPADTYDDVRDVRERWPDDVHDQRPQDIRAPVANRASQNELDEDFFADEDEFDNEDHAPAKKSRKKLIIAAVAGAIGVGGAGAYFYKTTIGGSDNATPVIRADSKPAREAPSNPGGRQFANGEKAIYDRLTPQGPQTASALVASQDPPARPSDAGAGKSFEDRVNEAWRRSQVAGGGSAAPASAGQPKPNADQPTVVSSERYGPDGKRIDNAARPVVVGAPVVSAFAPSQLPPPFGTAQTAPAPLPVPFATQTQPAAAPAPFRVASAQPNPAAKVASSPSAQAVSSAPSQTRTAALTPPSSPAGAGGFYVQIKSSQDEKAAAREVPGLTEKYSSVLGETPLTTKTVDLGDKGVWFRVMAGPLPSKEAAMTLCSKMKAANLQCVVPRE